MRKTTLIFISAALLTIFFCRIPTPASGQAFGLLRGKVSDEIRNPIAHARILVRSSKAEYIVEADEKGGYKIRLPAGEYQVIIKERPGFAEYKRDKVRVRSWEATVLSITPESRIYYEDCDTGLMNP